MFKLIAATLLLCCAAKAEQQVLVNRCLPSLGKYPFDAQKFSGDWYVIASVFEPKFFASDVKCEKIHYSAELVGNVTKTRQDIVFKMADGKEIILESRGQALRKDWASSSSVSYKFLNGSIWYDVAKHSILATDYTSYALVHVCRETYDDKTDMFGKMVADHIWSRTKTLDPKVLKTLKSVMSSLDIANEDWQLADNSAC